MTSERDLEDRLSGIGFSKADAVIYIELVAGRCSSVQQLLRSTRLTPEEVAQSISKLQMFCLVRTEALAGRERIRPVDPKLSWTALLYDENWRMDADGPAGDAVAVAPGAGRPRARAMSEILAMASKLFETGQRYQREGQKLFEHSDQFALSCSHALMKARAFVIAAERSPKLPQVALFWTAIVEMRKRSVQYRRYAGISEVFLHGLEITTRDVESWGVDTRYLPEEDIPSSLYLIDGEVLYLFSSEANGQPFSGRVSYNPGMIDRYRQVKVDSMERNARTFGEIKTSLLAHVDRLRGRAKTCSGDLEVFDRVARLGKFARLNRTECAAAAAMCNHGLLQGQPGGFSLSVAGHDWPAIA